MKAASLRGIVKRLVRWDSGTPSFWQAWLRSYFMRDVDPAIRYGPALETARAARRVLEVGSGPYGIAPFVGRRVIGVDLSFAGPRDRRLLPVVASGTALPFAAAAFDVVLCFDVLEHVSRAARAPLVRELARVCAGQLLIAVPFGDGARDADRRAAELHRRVVGEPHRWLAEHLENGTPDLADLDGVTAAVGRPPARRLAYTALWLWWLARREEIQFRPDLTFVRRVLLPPFAARLWRLPSAGAYRMLLAYDLSAPSAARPAPDAAVAAVAAPAGSGG